MVTQLFWIRHGETEWNRFTRFQGLRDVPLSETGVEQAHRAAEYLKNQPFSAIYSSDLKRARQTAEIIAAKHSLPVESFPELRERCCGDWEGKTRQEIGEQYPDWETVSLHGGKYGVEKTSEVVRRFLAKCEELARKHQGETIAIVAHGMCMNAVISKITDGELGLGKSRIKNTGISRLTYEEGKGFQIISFNDTSHLEADPHRRIWVP